MNCKPGDLAILIAPGPTGEAHNIGMIVEVVKPCPTGRAGFWWVVSQGRPGINRMNMKVQSGAVHDARLRPIRPGDLEDETPTVRELEAA